MIKQESDTYPTKLKQMMEEVRFASERHQEQAEKFGSEQAAIVA